MWRGAVFPKRLSQWRCVSQWCRHARTEKSGALYPFCENLRYRPHIPTTFNVRFWFSAYSAERSGGGACLLMFPIFFSMLLVKLWAAWDSWTLQIAKLCGIFITLIKIYVWLLYVASLCPPLIVEAQNILGGTMPNTFIAPVCANYEAFWVFFRHWKPDFFTAQTSSLY